MASSIYDAIIEYSPISKYCTQVYIISSISFVLSYYVIAFAFSLNQSSLPATSQVEIDAELKKEKMRAWIVTAISSLGMTVASIPFVLDLLLSGGNVASVQRREILSQTLTSSFMGYLLCDCALGFAHYRSQFSILTGWIHHSCYTVLLTFILKADIAHNFALAAIMELPTFVLALAMVVPATRNDELFSVLFFLTRILLHAVFACLYGSSYGQNHASGLFDSNSSPIATALPLYGLILAAPMHIMWFTSSTKGLLKRRRTAARLAISLATKIAVEEVEQIPTEPSTIPTPTSPYLLPARSEKLVSIASYYLSSSSIRISNSLPYRRRSPAAPNFDFLVRDYFRLPSGVEMVGDENVAAMTAGLGNTREMMQNIRVRAGRGGDEIKRFGGRLRRRVGGIVAAL